MGVRRDLNNLSGQQLLIIAFISALVSALFHSGYFYYKDLPVYFLSMLGGDFLGSVVVLYTVKALLNRFSQTQTARD
jgi:glycerol uptake facilitator-like aquaporin